ncbi:unnamed protein product [Amoebophrya sp. A120]|nr:unnamed protein product [Amoebophrya sp. A120]|eukprot:GSA120T00004573001.1
MKLKKILTRQELIGSLPPKGCRCWTRRVFTSIRGINDQDFFLSPDRTFPCLRCLKISFSFSYYGGRLVSKLELKPKVLSIRKPRRFSENEKMSCKYSRTSSIRN